MGRNDKKSQNDKINKSKESQFRLPNNTSSPSIPPENTSFYKTFTYFFKKVWMALTTSSLTSAELPATHTAKLYKA